MRLIDADALIEDIDGDLTDSIAEGRAIEKIMNAPTIEPEVKFIRLPNENPVDMFPLLTEEEKQQSREYAQGYSDALAERKKGKWIEDGYYDLPCVCSYCGTEGERKWNFCPNCGSYNGDNEKWR